MSVIPFEEFLSKFREEMGVTQSEVRNYALPYFYVEFESTAVGLWMTRLAVVGFGNGATLKYLRVGPGGKPAHKAFANFTYHDNWNIREVITIGHITCKKHVLRLGEK